MKKTKITKKQVSKKETVKSPTCSIVVTLGDQVFEGSGETLVEAMKSISIPVKITTKGTIDVKDGDKRATLAWPMFRVRKMFYPNALHYHAKMLSYLTR